MITMKAAVCGRYGPPDVLRIADVPRPVPAADEILVRVRASTVNSSDWYARSGVRRSPLAVQVPFRLLVGIRRPRQPILGLVLAGEAVETGSAVTNSTRVTVCGRSPSSASAPTPNTRA